MIPPGISYKNGVYAGDGKFSTTFLKHRDQLQAETIETQIVTKSGEIKDVAIRASAIELRGKKIMLANFQDVTKRKQAEEALHETEERYISLFDRSLDCV